MPAVVNKDEMRLSIIRAFEKCADEKPILKITLRDIAKEAGIHHATILYYFKDKSEIITCYARYVADEYLNLKESETGAEDIHEFLYRFFDIDEQNRHTRVSVQLYAMSVFDESIHQVMRQMYQSYRIRLREYLQNRYGRNMDSEADTLLMMIEGALLYRLNNRLEKEEIRKMIRTVADTF